MASRGMYGGEGFLGGFGPSLTEGIRAAMQYKLDKAEAQKMIEAQRWAEDPRNPENLLKAATARGMENTKNQTIDAGNLFGPDFKGRQIPVEAALPYLFAKFGALKTGPIAAGAKGAGAGGGTGAIPLDPEDQKTLGDLSTELSLFKGAYDTAGKNKLFNPSIKNDLVQGLLGTNSQGLPFVGNEVANRLPQGAQDYNTRMKDAMFRVAKILSGGRPNEQMQKELQAQIPQIGLSQPNADAQFNALLGSAEARAQAMIDKRRQISGEAAAQALSDQLNSIFGKFRMGQEGAGVSSNLPASGLQPPPGGATAAPAPGPTPQTSPAPGGTADQGQGAAPKKDPTDLAKTIMNDPEASDQERAWAAKFYTPPAAPKVPVLAPPPPGVPGASPAATPTPLPTT